MSSDFVVNLNIIGNASNMITNANVFKKIVNLQG